jgi:hypothetical protein
MHRRRRWLPADEVASVDEVSLSELERDPELLAAERAVDDLPPPPVSSHPLRDVIIGPRPQIVGLDEDGDPSAP